MILLFCRCRAILMRTRLIHVCSKKHPDFSDQAQQIEENQPTTSTLTLIWLIMIPGAPTSLQQLKEVDPDLHSFLSRLLIRPFTFPFLALNVGKMCCLTNIFAGSSVTVPGAEHALEMSMKQPKIQLRGRKRSSSAKSAFA